MTMDTPHSEAPLCLPYLGAEPTLGTVEAAGRGACLIGRVTLGEEAILGDDAVLRGDGDWIAVGEMFCLGARGTVHIAHERLPCRIGDRVSAGADCVIHACTVGSDVVLGAGCIVLDEALLPDRVILDPGTIVFPRMELASDTRYAGVPARPVGEIGVTDLALASAAVREAAMQALSAGTPAEEPWPAFPDNFVASTCRVVGKVALAEAASLFFSCRVEAGAHEIRIGARSNVQDNSHLLCSEGPLEIGADVTIGHNVTLDSCTVKARSLVGIGARLAPGSVVEEDVLIAAGTVGAPGQLFESGWLYAGAPARKLSRMTDDRRARLAGIIPHYCSYAAYFHGIGA